MQTEFCLCELNSVCTNQNLCDLVCSSNVDCEFWVQMWVRMHVLGIFENLHCHATGRPSHQFTTPEDFLPSGWHSPTHRVKLSFSPVCGPWHCFCSWQWNTGKVEQKLWWSKQLCLRQWLQVMHWHLVGHFKQNYLFKIWQLHQAQTLLHNDQGCDKRFACNHFLFLFCIDPHHPFWASCQ